MKKLFPVIIGVLIGSAMAVGMIVHGSSINTAYGEESSNGWMDIVASGNAFEWRDIFPPYSNRGLYDMVYKKLLVDPDKDALGDVAQGYGLTKDEAYAVVNGSITPIFNNPDQKSYKLTKEQALEMAAALREEYEFYQELYDIQMEVDVAISATEIFANGDLSDSGFDLVHDLDVIEEILFQDRTETTIGQPFDNALDKPYFPTDRDETNDSYIADKGIAEIYNLEFVSIDENTSDENNKNQKQASLKIGDKDIPVTIDSEDICESDNKYMDALNDFADEDKTGNSPDSFDGSDENSDLNADDGADGNGISGNNSDSGLPVGVNNSELEVSADQWLKSWCPSLEDAPDAPGTFGTTGFKSLRGSGESVKDILDQANISAGAASGYTSEQFSAQVAICLNVELIWQRVASYQPGDSCIDCELDKINTYMGKTLDHSLSPNKATGNLMESAKCKAGYGEFIDMQFVTMAKPIPVPSDDDVIFGRNIAEEWDEFLQNYQPLGFNMLTEGGNTENFSNSQLKKYADNASTNTSVSDLVDKVALELADKESEAKAKLNESINSSDAKNIIIQAQTVLQNLQQMTAYFKGYNKMYQDVATDVCPAILNKKST